MDAFGQWLTQLPVIAQTVVLLGLLVPLGGLVAFAFIGVIDIVVGRVSRRWAARPAREARPRVTLADDGRGTGSGNGPGARNDGAAGTGDGAGPATDD